MKLNILSIVFALSSPKKLFASHSLKIHIIITAIVATKNLIAKLPKKILLISFSFFLTKSSGMNLIRLVVRPRLVNIAKKLMNVNIAKNNPYSSIVRLLASISFVKYDINDAKIEPANKNALP